MSPEEMLWWGSGGLYLSMIALSFSEVRNRILGLSRRWYVSWLDWRIARTKKRYVKLMMRKFVPFGDDL